MLDSWNIEARASGPSKLEIAVHSAIGQTFFLDGVVSKDILSALRAAPDAREIELRVNSPGGILDDAKSMVNLLAERAAAGVTITGHVDGIAASAASYLLTAAHRVVMPANAFQMLHAARGGVRGTSSDVEAYAALLRRTTDQLAEAYAAASARRGKGKTKEDFLALFAAGDTYLDADEAIAWGLADAKVEPLKVAACLVDLSGLDGAPEALRSAPYVGAPTARVGTTEAVMFPNRAAIVASQPTTPSSGARAEQPTTPTNTGGKETQMKTIIQALALQEDADEAAVVAAIKKIQASSRVSAEIERLVGVSGDAALGAVRALKEAQTQHAELAAEVSKVKANLARRDFEGARAEGLKEKKLTPAVAKMYTDRFEASLAGGDDGSAVVAELQGFLAVAPRLVSAAVANATGSNGVISEGPMQHNGKAFEAMSAMERHRLKEESPELYDSLRADAVQRKAI